MTEKQKIILDTLLSLEKQRKEGVTPLVKASELNNDGLLIEGLICKADGSALSLDELIDVFEANNLLFGGSTTPYHEEDEDGPRIRRTISPTPPLQLEKTKSSSYSPIR